MIYLFYILSVLVFVCYIATAFSYWQLFFKEQAAYTNSSRVLLITSICLHTFLLLAIGFLNQRCPLGTAGEGLLFCTWMIAVVHLTSEFFAKSKPWGIFTLLPVTAGVLISLFLLDPALTLPPEHRGSFFAFHIVSSLAAYACFTISAILATMYILLFKKLKSKQFDVFFRTLPPLENIELLESIWVYFGILFMTISPIIGWIWVSGEGRTGMHPREWGIFAVLVVFAVSAIARFFFRFRGIRFAISIIIGFVLLLMTQIFHVHGF